MNTVRGVPPLDVRTSLSIRDCSIAACLQTCGPTSLPQQSEYEINLSVKLGNITDDLQGTIVSLCILSGLLTIARTIFRFRKFGRIYTEDIFLFIALLSLAAGTGVFYATIDGLVYEAGINGHTITPAPDLPHNYPTIDVKIDT